MAAHKVDCLVIGSGVVGLSIARGLAKRGREVLVLDKASSIGAETSSRNSQVIHSGIYYPDKSLKARFCVEGKNLLYDYCKERHIPVNRCGKLVVATSKEQFQSAIPQLLKQARQNGVTDAEIISKDQVSAMEPLVECHGALYSPSTGVLDASALMSSLLADAESDGAILALHSKVCDAQVEPDGCVSVFAEDTWITARYVVNAAGLWADRIARLLHDKQPCQTSSWQPPRQYFCKGTYFQLQSSKEQPFAHLIYPIPDRRGGLGVHATVDVAGHVKFGPDVEWLNADAEPDTLDYTPESRRLDASYTAIRAYYPSLPDGSLHVDFTGVRPKLSHPSLDASASALLFRDFRIATAEEHGVPGVVHLLGMESPGLTSSMAIAEYVCDEVLAPDGE